MADIELTGVDEILNKLQQIGTNISRLENKALRNAAELMQKLQTHLMIEVVSLEKVLR